MKELAEQLKAERLKQGLTLEAVSQRAHISVGVLNDLEEGHFERIGTPLLIRSFIRGYCSVLGIDPASLLEQHDAEISSYDRQGDSIRRYGTWSRAVDKRKRMGLITLFILGLFVVSVFYGGAWLYKNRAGFSPAQNVVTSSFPQQELPSDLQEEKASPVDTQGKDSGSAAKSESGSGAAAHGADKGEPVPPVTRIQQPIPQKAPAEGDNPAEVLVEEKPAAVAQKHHFEIEVDQKTWVQVRIDNKTSQNVLLQPGEKRDWEAQDTLQATVGNGRGVHMKWDGATINPPGKPGRAFRLTLPEPAPGAVAAKKTKRP